MEICFLPSRQKSSVINIVLMTGLVLLGSVLAVLANLSVPSSLTSLLVGIAFLLAIPFFYVFYQYNNARRIRYLLDDQTLRIHWGASRWIVPLRKIDWAHQLSEFEDEMPLPRWHLPGGYLNLFKVHGMGLTRFVATKPADMILIKADERYVVISPDDPLAFLAILTERKSLATLTDATIEEENFRTMLIRLWKEKGMKRMLITGVLALAVLWIVISLMIALRQKVTWVTMEEVPASRLLILPIFGSFLWMISHVLSFFILINENAEKLMVYMVLGSSVVMSLMLALAGIMMAL